MTRNHDDVLENHPKPTIEQAAWVLSHALDHMVEGGSFRYFIYDRLGYGLLHYAVGWRIGLFKPMSSAQRAYQQGCRGIITMTKITKPWMAGINMPSVAERKKAIKAGKDMVGVPTPKRDVFDIIKPKPYPVDVTTMRQLADKLRVNTDALDGAILLAACNCVKFDDIYKKAARKMGWKLTNDRFALMFNVVNDLINHEWLNVIQLDRLLTNTKPGIVHALDAFVKFKAKKR
jgi:hypothetical protein